MSDSDLPLVHLGQGDYQRDITPHGLTTKPTTMKNVLAYSGMHTFRNSPLTYKHRHLNPGAASSPAWLCTAISARASSPSSTIKGASMRCEEGDDDRTCNLWG